MIISNLFLKSLIILTLTSCSHGSFRAISFVNSLLVQSAASHREPSLGNGLLVTLANKKGREVIEMIDVKNGKRIALPGLNSANTHTINMSISSNGQLIAFIRQRGENTELLLYRRNQGTIRKLDIIPKGVPKQVAIDGLGRIVAVQVSRNGRWDIDVINIKN